MDSIQLGIDVDTSKVTAATKALDDLAAAADRARDALQALGCAVIIATADEDDDLESIQ